VDLKVLHCAAELAPPAIPLKDMPAQ